jgi:hypothetical protein
LDGILRDGEADGGSLVFGVVGAEAERLLLQRAVRHPAAAPAGEPRSRGGCTLPVAGQLELMMGSNLLGFFLGLAAPLVKFFRALCGYGLPFRAAPSLGLGWGWGALIGIHRLMAG